MNFIDGISSSPLHGTLNLFSILQYKFNEIFILLE